MDPTYSSVDHDDITVESNTESAADIRANFGLETPAAPVAEPEAVEEPVAEPEPAKIDKRTREGRKASIQQEIDDLTATKHTTKRELEEARTELVRLKADLAAAAAPKVETPKPTADPEPTPDGFDTYEKYVKAQARWEARQEAASIRAEWKKETDAAQAQQLETQRRQSWADRLFAFKTKTPDFDARFKGDTPMSTPMRDILMDSPVGPDLLLYLSEHQDDAQRLSTLHPIQVIREMGKLEARLETAVSGPVPTTPPVSQAKPPIKPLGSSPPNADADAYSDDETVEAHFARENARERKAGRR